MIIVIFYMGCSYQYINDKNINDIQLTKKEYYHDH